MDPKQISSLFTERPQKYGYRGDYYFWGYLEEYFKSYPQDLSAEAFAGCIKERFETLSGTAMTNDAKPFVLQFSNGGMSSGMLSGEFWGERAIPLLLERFKQLEENGLE